MSLYDDIDGGVPPWPPPGWGVPQDPAQQQAVALADALTGTPTDADKKKAEQFADALTGTPASPSAEADKKQAEAFADALTGEPKSSKPSAEQPEIEMPAMDVSRPAPGEIDMPPMYVGRGAPDQLPPSFPPEYAAAQAAGLPAPVGGPPPGAMPQDPYGAAPASVDAVSGVGGLPPPPTKPDQRAPVDPYEVMPGGMTRDEAARVDYYDKNPLAREEESHYRQVTDHFESLRRQSELARQQALDAERNYNMLMAAHEKTQRDSDQMVADAQRLSQTKIDPKRHGMSASEGLGLVLGALAGGMNHTGQNLALEQYNRKIEQDIDAQKADLDNAWKGIGIRKGAIADEYARHGDLFRAQEAYRLASYQRAIDQISVDEQQYDPNGQIGREMGRFKQGLLQQQAQAKLKADQQLYLQNKQYYEVEKQKADLEKTKADTDKIRAELAAKKGDGTGGATNTKYTVPVNINDPFQDKPTPIFGTRKLSQTEEKEIGAAVDKYHKSQVLWNNLYRSGARIGFDKDPASYVTSAMKDADERQYEADRAALINFNAKDEGGKISKEQLELQNDQIPDLKGILSQDDPAKRIRTAQEHNDEEFIGKIRIAGVNGDPLIESARNMRKDEPAPSSDDQLSAAQGALAQATSPKEKRDAEAAVDAARKRKQAEHKAEGETKIAEDKAAEREKNVGDYRAPHWSSTGLPDKLAAAIDTRNSALKSFNDYAARHREISSDASWDKKGLGVGERDAARKAHEQKSGAAATAMDKWHHLAEKSQDDAFWSLVDSVYGQDANNRLSGAKLAHLAELMHVNVKAVTPEDWHTGDSTWAARRDLAVKLRQLDSYKRGRILKRMFEEAQ